ncbi:S-adenosyl-L-methionine-dependent methyltransferase superfamily protein [Rhynchospora pubera]|uniref:S-adenosyl-L-methionine-dependent methyltransferase superfamily protein n=1 Tax=Rhynchospora pubera TaxID=906938 RepID=A0AAV8G2K4_9POAL|nr:S-adenosyl-L-methionine-dependent methyltransferase superfamily protein [Rhynchospora pubera]KAJ4750313.1 S-adenosyl-L-methionine-dependent methyltransferase superfamily protein [Rhynchospora pubera]KAJ4796742.1 S-adenosyl-L-methionine-dependent methyltransferase superfamily protein [Rhynchospora pubera]
MVSSLLPSPTKHLRPMHVETILHMKEGLGDTSYSQNSSLQRNSIETLKNIIINSALDVYISLSPEQFTLADLGCSSGPNTVTVAGEIIKKIGGICHKYSIPAPDFSVMLNDLPTNDFNTVFVNSPEFIQSLKDFAEIDEWGHPTVFVAGVPGSFYGRLFPRRSVHFVSSCSSLHWLSKVPPGLFNDIGQPVNKGKMYISHTSPPEVAKAYYKQFQGDFSKFLKARSVEIVSGGRMVLAMLGRRTQDHSDPSTTLLWELLAQSFDLLVSHEIIDQEKLNSYNVPFYAPNIIEIEEEVRKEGSFAIDYIDTFETKLNASGDARKDGKVLSMAIRAIQESMLSHHFGGDIIDALFNNYTELLIRSMEREEIKSVQIGVVLRKL